MIKAEEEVRQKRRVCDNNDNHKVDFKWINSEYMAYFVVEKAIEKAIE